MKPDRLSGYEFYSMLYGDGIDQFMDKIKAKRVEEETKKKEVEDITYAKYEERAKVFRAAHEKAETAKKAKM